MHKLNAACGLSTKQIGIIKYKIKRAVSLRLPVLPENVEMMLFFQGRDAWTYSWRLLDQIDQNSQRPISVEVDVKLKKEFLQYQLRARYTFVCQLRLQPDVYEPKISIHEKAV